MNTKIIRTMFFSFVVLGFEFKAWTLLGKHSIT
jgi:hypothetical protein